jgi:hypothetical protein
MLFPKKKTKKKSNRQKLLASLGDKYDAQDYKDDKATVEAMKGVASEAQINRILERMRRRSWD